MSVSPYEYAERGMAFRDCSCSQLGLIAPGANVALSYKSFGVRKRVLDSRRLLIAAHLGQLVSVLVSLDLKVSRHPMQVKDVSTVCLKPSLDLIL